jgi:PBP4 family serine-type D-alanyl-D-alanine carboxypeptidase
VSRLASRFRRGCLGGVVVLALAVFAPEGAFVDRAFVDGALVSRAFARPKAKAAPAAKRAGEKPAAGAAKTTARPSSSTSSSTSTSTKTKAEGSRSASATKSSTRRDSSSDEIPVPPASDRDHDRIRRMQDTLSEILRNRTLGRLRVGLRVVSARTGRLYYGRRDDTLMDPASNQKVLATTAALMRLGADWQFRTELSGPEPDGDGVVSGNIYLRGNSDPALHAADLEALAARLRARGITRIDGAVMADPRRIGDDGRGDDDGERAPLIVDSGMVLVRVRPGPSSGTPAVVIVTPAPPAGEEGRGGVVVRNQAVTRDGGRRARVAVKVGVTDGRVRIDVSGKIPLDSGGVAFRRKVPRPALHAAVVMRSALVSAGIPVREGAGTATQAGPAGFVEVHRSPPLSVVLRKINKDSNNDWAERVLQAVGAEERGGAASTEKGLSVLREVIGAMGLRPNSYVPKNGSGLGHANRITPHAMADLLRELYFDPRVGPEILQSLSVGGVDGTTRNRFKGTLAARRVRAKTGTLNGKSCLSGLVGDGDDVLVFSMMVQGLRGRSLPAVRASQVGAVTALMRYVREGTGERIELPRGFDEQMTGDDYEVGGEATESGAEGEGDRFPLTADIMPLSGEPVRAAPAPGANAPVAGRAPAVTGAPASAVPASTTPPPFAAPPLPGTARR